MDFDFGEREKDITKRLRDLFDQGAVEGLVGLESTEVHQIKDLLLKWMRRLGEAGYFAFGLETGKNSVALVATQETLSTIAPSLFLSVETSARVFGRLVAVYGTSDQKTNLLPAIKEGRLIGAVGLSEGVMNIEKNPLRTTGVPAGAGFRVSGEKRHVVNALVADLIAVAGKTDDRMAFFLIEKDTQGLSIGQRLATLGYGGVVISPITLEDCHVPSRYLIGPFGNDEPLRKVRSWEDEILTSASLGLMRSVFDAASSHAKTHISGGKPIIAYQEIGFKLAEMLTLLQTAQLLAYRAAWMAETGDSEADVLTHCAKVFCTESAERLASASMQILGEHGYVKGNPAEEGYRNAKYLQIAGTSTEISRVKIGDEVLERN